MGVGVGVEDLDLVGVVGDEAQVYAGGVLVVYPWADVVAARLLALPRMMDDDDRVFGGPHFGPGHRRDDVFLFLHFLQRFLTRHRS
ncbi:hypothetical protein [Embleya sp. AB8]|uniref:hypothetical protein n=1 Tax=Embleya sp. AB8 TaxID=3156304 RepID=UPI003C7847F4